MLLLPIKYPLTQPGHSSQPNEIHTYAKEPTYTKKRILYESIPILLEGILSTLKLMVALKS